jgi:branched-chain amino acid transport system ATP-binding protein
MLDVADLHAHYGSSHVLFGLHLRVAEGEVVVLLGRNGAGKTTTLKSIMGVLPSRAGTIRFKGTNIGRFESDAIARLGLGYVPEDCRIFRGLSVQENLETGRRAPLGGRETWDERRIFQLFPALQLSRSRRADALSGGQQRMLAVARTLMGNPDLLLLDEPSEGLAPLVVEALRERIAELKRDGLTILLAEQSVDFCLALADRVYVLEKGAVQYSGTADAFRADRSIQARYLEL